MTPIPSGPTTPPPPRSPETIAAVEALADRLRACSTPAAVARVAAEIADDVARLAQAEPMIAVDLRNLVIWKRRGLVEGWLPPRPQPQHPPTRARAWQGGTP